MCHFINEPIPSPAFPNELQVRRTKTVILHVCREFSHYLDRVILENVLDSWEYKVEE